MQVCADILNLINNKKPGGRLISVIAILVGICIVAIATGALYNQIAFNNEEQYCMALLQVAIKHMCI